MKTLIEPTEQLDHVQSYRAFLLESTFIKNPFTWAELKELVETANAQEWREQKRLFNALASEVVIDENIQLRHCDIVLYIERNVKSYVDYYNSH